jgi:uncharacterized protein YbbK (DUF523 family)
VQRVLVSACLLGERVRYHGGHAVCDNAHLIRWINEGRVCSICPEVVGGLPTPREPAEIAGARGGAAVLEGAVRVLGRGGSDLTRAFVAGAAAAVAMARANGVRVAVLKEGSPSCGSREVSDGTFTGRRTAAQGVTAAALRDAGVWVFNGASVRRSSTHFDSARRWCDGRPAAFSTGLGTR